jgi:hypothetical protein
MFTRPGDSVVAQVARVVVEAAVLRGMVLVRTPRWSRPPSQQDRTGSCRPHSALHRSDRLSPGPIAVVSWLPSWINVAAGCSAARALARPLAGVTAMLWTKQLLPSVRRLCPARGIPLGQESVTSPPNRWDMYSHVKVAAG